MCEHSDTTQTEGSLSLFYGSTGNHTETLSDTCFAFHSPAAHFSVCIYIYACFILFLETQGKLSWLNPMLPHPAWPLHHHLFVLNLWNCAATAALSFVGKVLTTFAHLDLLNSSWQILLSSITLDEDIFRPHVDVVQGLSLSLARSLKHF